MDQREGSGATPGHGPVSLRPVTLSDLNFLKSWWSDAEANYYDTGVARDGPDEGFLDRIGRMVIGGGLPSWRIIEVGGIGPVGYVLHRGLDRSGGVEMAIRLGREHWGCGYGTAAIRLFTDHLFSDLGVKRVWLEVAEFNERARRAYARAGFVETARRPARDGLPGIIVMEAWPDGIAPAQPGHTKSERSGAPGKGVRWMDGEGRGSETGRRGMEMGRRATETERHEARREANPSNEETEMRNIAAECSEYTPVYNESLVSLSDPEALERSCGTCAHFDGGECRIYRRESGANQEGNPRGRR